MYPHRILFKVKNLKKVPGKVGGGISKIQEFPGL